MTNSPTLGEQLRYARLRRGLTTVQIAERAGIARTTLVKIEKGDEGVALGQYFRVMLALGLLIRVRRERITSGFSSIPLQTDGGES